jgi:hypothetical protein
MIAVLHLKYIKVVMSSPVIIGNIKTSLDCNRIGGVMVGVLTSSVVDLGFETR